MWRSADRLRTLRVADVMTRQVVELSPDQSLDEVGQLFRERDVSSAPVLDAQRRCVGVLSAADFLRHTGQPGGVVADVMSRRVRTVGAQELLLKAAHIMSANHVHRLPVLGDDQRVVGVVSTMDFVAAVMNVLDEVEASQFRTADF